MSATSPSADRADGAGGGATLLEVRDIGVRFGGVRAVDGVSFGLTRGVSCGMIGPNGAGKTTLLDVLAGLRAPTTGAVLLDGERVEGTSSCSLARAGVRRTFQRQQPFGRLSVEENILVALEWRGRSTGVIGDLVGWPGRRRATGRLRVTVDEAIERCGLQAVRGKPAGSLPIGQVRLLEFARAIVDSPRLLLLDEPTSGLGRSETDVLGGILAELIAEGDCSLILVEHDLEFVFGLCQRVLVLDQGRVLADGPPQHVRVDPAVITAYIGDH